jgi:hypothetical protein
MIFKTQCTEDTFCEVSGTMVAEVAHPPQVDSAG